jgi:hypothetical protein
VSMDLSSDMEKELLVLPMPSTFWDRL